MKSVNFKESEFFRLLAEKSPKGIHNAYQGFVHMVQNLCKDDAVYGKDYVITELTKAEAELLHNIAKFDLTKDNVLLVIFAHKASQLVQCKLNGYFIESSKRNDNMAGFHIGGLKWMRSKTDFVELCRALNGGQCFGPNIPNSVVERTLSKVFDVELSDNYAAKKFSEMKTRAKESRTYFIDHLKDCLERKMNEDDEQKPLCG